MQQIREPDNRKEIIISFYFVFDFVPARFAGVFDFEAFRCMLFVPSADTFRCMLVFPEEPSVDSVWGDP